MIKEKLDNLLKREKKDLIFFFDEDGSMKEDLKTIENAGFNVLEVKQNYFEIKHFLEFEKKNEKIFLYHPFKRPAGKELMKYPLLDLLTANVELRLDDASEFLSDFNLQPHHLPLVKRYLKQLKTKNYQKKLGRILDREHFTETNIKRGIISVLLDFNSIVDKNSCIIKWLYYAVDDEPKFKKINSSVEELDLDVELKKWISNLFVFEAPVLGLDLAKELACNVKYNILAAYIDKPHQSDTYRSLKLDRSIDINRIIAFFQDWEKNKGLKKYIEPILNNLAQDINTDSILNWYGSTSEYGHYSEEMMNNLIKETYEVVVKDPLSTINTSVKWLREEELTESFKLQYSFIYHASKVISVLNNYKSFVFNKAEDFIAKYSEELFKVDLNYRKAISAFEESKDKLFEHEDEAIALLQHLNQKYDRFLIELNVEWQKVLTEKNFNFKEIDVKKQYEFYNHNIKGFDYKVAVIISDALRFELGYELYDELLADSKNNLSIEPYLASIPSYTNLGMSNLLPNTGITVENGENDLIFKIDDVKTDSAKRKSILKKEYEQSTTVNYSEFRKMDKKAKRAFFKENKLTYIYHDWIDAIGDKKRTEHGTFEATQKAKEEIQWMVSNLSGELGVSHVYVTSDHGFLFNYNELPESSREALPKTKGYTKEHVRFVISEGFEGKIDGHELELRNTTNIDTDLKIAIPRAINRYRKKGNIGVQFVHGGASLQELIVPVLKFYRHKTDSHELVGFKRIDQIDKITSGSIKVKLLQDQPVSNEYKSRELVFGLYSDNNELISNEKELQINSTSENPKERVIEFILNLNSVGSMASKCYLKAFDIEDKNRLNPIEVNDLIKISSLIEKDEF